MSISTKGSVTWSAPSNIALIKYWGKMGDQLPCNPSLSLTLQKARTITSMKWESGNGMTFLFEGKETKFQERVQLFLDSIDEIYPFLKDYKLSFDSQNSFPHGAGIASSASAMSSIALCLGSMEEVLVGAVEDFKKKASYIARLGSGSASRSIYGGAVSWGDLSNEYASEIVEMNAFSKRLNDAILIVDSSEKSISSSKGHGLMVNHPFADARYSQARDNFKELMSAFSSSDFERVGDIIEAEALSIHSMMMTSSTPYILIRPNTLQIIECVRRFRSESGVPIFFTLDAGPNVHLIYDGEFESKVTKWIDDELVQYCESWIADSVGDGPFKVE